MNAAKAALLLDTKATDCPIPKPVLFVGFAILLNILMPTDTYSVQCLLGCNGPQRVLEAAVAQVSY
jgi:hypothetical protein